MAFPPCGIYRTQQDLGEAIPRGRLVYFHAHGDPGPGVYLPSGWTQNRARWHKSGVPVPDEAWAATLEPLAPEGFYRVHETFHCCDKKCRAFERELLVQLGYNGVGEAILFVPELTPEGLRIPDAGSALAADRVRLLSPLKVLESAAVAAQTTMLH